MIEEEKCIKCDGVGQVEMLCSTCNGSGEGRRDGSRCANCEGLGTCMVYCPKCEGEGFVND